MRGQLGFDIGLDIEFYFEEEKRERERKEGKILVDFFFFDRDIWRDDISLLRNIGRKMHIQFKLNSRSSSIVACRCSESNDSSSMLLVDRT